MSATADQCRRKLETQVGVVSGTRRVLLEAALRGLEQLPDLPLPRSVKDEFCREFAFIATADDVQFAKYEPGTARYDELLKIATLRRFPAGQFDWEVGGISRSDLLRVQPAQLPRALWFVARRMHGLRPVFFCHLNRRRPSRSLREDEALRSYFRMAEAMREQREIRGFAACSWFRSPATHAVSPRLAWLSRVFVENGGMVLDAGYEEPNCGVLTASPTRRRLYDEGRFRPRRGLVMWPRDAMLHWAAQHPELRDQTASQR
jgi:hypothetical protein